MTINIILRPINYFNAPFAYTHCQTNVVLEDLFIFFASSGSFLQTVYALAKRFKMIYSVRLSSLGVSVSVLPTAEVGTF